MEKSEFDLVIIGGGPAGLTAGIYASRARLKTLLLEKFSPGGQITLCDWIENYPGFPDGISGADLVQMMTQQAKRFELSIENSEVIDVNLTEPTKRINLKNRSISARSIIIASGASPKKLLIPGENIFYGKGLSTCATCDGPFYKNKIVAAIGGGDTAIQESLFLTKFAKKVYVIHRRDKLRATQILQDRAFSNDKIEFIWDSVVTDIKGLSHVENISIQNLKTDNKSDLKVDGCFIWVGILPNTEFLINSIQLDTYGFISTDSNMATSVPGVFAAGDVRDTPLRQITTAVGDAAIAALSAEHYINEF